MATLSSTRSSGTSPGNAGGPGRLGPDPETIATLCRAAHDYVQRATGMSMDQGEESLAFVDHYLSVVRSTEISDEVLTLVSAALGAHLGEVAIAKFGGAWRGPLPTEPGDADDPANWRVELSCAPLTFDPVGMAAEALRQGEVEGYQASLSTRGELSTRLFEALARVPPVSDEYFYSLTGRLETITYAVDLLLEIQRQDREGVAGPAKEDEDDPRGDDAV